MFNQSKMEHSTNKQGLEGRKMGTESDGTNQNKGFSCPHILLFRKEY
jgi:hypothetical protein